MNPLTLNITLPAYQFEAASSTEPLPPTISANPAHYEKRIQQLGQFTHEHINRAAMSGDKRLTDEMVQKANSSMNAYMLNVNSKFPVQESSPLVGSGRTTSLKMATQKKLTEE